MLLPQKGVVALLASVAEGDRVRLDGEIEGKAEGSVVGRGVSSIGKLEGEVEGKDGAREGEAVGEIVSAVDSSVGRLVGKAEGVADSSLPVLLYPMRTIDAPRPLVPSLLSSNLPQWSKDTSTGRNPFSHFAFGGSCASKSTEIPDGLPSVSIGI